MNNFTKNNMLIRTHFRLNYKILLYFVIMACIFAVCVLMIFSIGGNTYIAPTEVYTKSGSSTSDTPLFGMPLSIIIFGIVGFVLFSIFAIVLINIAIIDEAKTGNIVYWMTTSNSRFQIILSKIAFIWYSILIIFFPYFITTICFSTKANDFGKWVGFIIARGLQFLVFILMISSIYALLGVLLIDKFAVFLSICIIFIAYSVAILILSKTLSEPWIKYISPSELIAEPIVFDDPADLPDNFWKDNPNQQIHNMVGKDEHGSVLWNVGSVFINLIIAILSSIGSIYTYKRLDFNV